eukprot:TRINITY_DN10721_c0_g1_i1.p1 TRINITY_DN10721_c0_g1~~TRINITY_DN10721_c0_g1_i1.p1  ORF type:complete len:122 (-),score=2.58 TRINITY_DN10721_c0_g1_i1:212-577(-)
MNSSIRTFAVPLISSFSFNSFHVYHLYYKHRTFFTTPSNSSLSSNLTFTEANLAQQLLDRNNLKGRREGVRGYFTAFTVLSGEVAKEPEEGRRWKGGVLTNGLPNMFNALFAHQNGNGVGR